MASCEQIRFVGQFTNSLTRRKARHRLLSLTEGKGSITTSKPTDLVQGTVDLLILKTIALEPMHGWAIAQRIRQVSKNVLQVNQGALYPALHRLEQQGWIRRNGANQRTIGGRNTGLVLGKA